MFNYPGGLDDLGPLLGQAGSWRDSRNSVRWHSLAGPARLPLGTTNHVRRFSPLAEGCGDDCGDSCACSNRLPWPAGRSARPGTRWSALTAVACCSSCPCRRPGPDHHRYRRLGSQHRHHDGWVPGLYGTSPGNYQWSYDAGNQVTAALTLTRGAAYYVAVRAYNTSARSARRRTKRRSTSPLRRPIPRPRSRPPCRMPPRRSCHGKRPTP